MAVVSEVVVGATLKELRITIIDEDGNPRAITGGTVRLQGKSADLPSKTLDVAGNIYDGPNGVARWTSLGGTGFVTTGDMGSVSRATFTCQVKYTDSGGLIDFGPEFEIVWKKPIV
jgi:hypothetical protein